MGWVNKASLTLPLFTEVPVPSQESEHSCVCVLVGIDFASFYDFSIGFWNCSDSVVFFYWVLELFRQCGIFLLGFGTVPTVVFFYWVLELFRQCGIFL
jgi:hypothetical protein